MTNESMDELKAAFDDWRRKKRYAREAAPADLLDRARRAAKAYGIGPVARVVKMERGRLKTPQPSKPARLVRKVPAPTFSRLELAAPRSIQPAAEAETPAGVKLRVFAITPETVGLLSSFCRGGGGV
jgi:hypothetical protein